MKKLIFATVAALALAAVSRADTTTATNALPDEKSRISYAIGLSIGHNLAAKGMDDIDTSLIGRGIGDVLAGRPELLTREQVGETLRNLQMTMQKRMAEKQNELATKNKAEGAAFLAKNKTAPGVQTQVVTLPDKTTHEFQYIVETNGTGPIPNPTDTVKVNYAGSLLDGTEFDSSYKRGQPGSFSVNGVIPGWSHALQNMPVGSKWKLFIPSELAYGEHGQQNIPPNSVLIFEVELLSIAATPPPPPPAPAAAPAAALSSPIVAVQGTNVHVLTPEEVEKAQQQAQQPPKQEK